MMHFQFVLFFSIFSDIFSLVNMEDKNPFMYRSDRVVNVTHVLNVTCRRVIVMVFNANSSIGGGNWRKNHRPVAIH